MEDSMIESPTSRFTAAALALSGLVLAASGCASRGLVLELELPVSSDSIEVQVRNVDGLPPFYQATVITTGLDAVDVFIPYPAQGTPPLPWAITVRDGGDDMSLERCVRSSSAPVRETLSLMPWDRDVDGFRNRQRVDCAEEPLDCDDTDPRAFPGSEAEAWMCGTTDLNCDGVIEDCPDADGDGFRRCVSTPRIDCDCNDADPRRNPDALDVCENGLDENCDGIDAPCDRDGDGYLPPEDCDDGDRDIHPFAEERCNLIDDDCNGAVDDGAICVEVDRDGDGYLACGTTEPTCDPNDCDVAVHPSAFDQCGDDVDADGDGFDACSGNDRDGDGYLDAFLGGSDCDDDDPLSHPLAADRCGDGVAQDCVADRSCAMDVDGDGWIEPAACEDGRSAPDGDEICNGRDDDCDGAIDEVLSPTSEAWPQGMSGCTTDPRPLDFRSDVVECGGCGIACNRGVERCVEGMCVAR
jgi:hypothetical protein